MKTKAEKTVYEISVTDLQQVAKEVLERSLLQTSAAKSLPVGD